MPRLALHVAAALITFLTGLCAAAVTNLSAGPPGPSAAAEEEVLELMRQFAPAQTRRDESFFERAEADSYVVHVGDGRTLTKSEAIAAMRERGTETRYAHEDLRVQVVGDVAVVTGWMIATPPGGEACATRWRSVYLLRKRGGRWQILSTTQAN